MASVIFLRKVLIIISIVFQVLYNGSFFPQSLPFSFQPLSLSLTSWAKNAHIGLFYFPPFLVHVTLLLSLVDGI